MAIQSVPRSPLETAPRGLAGGGGGHQGASAATARPPCSEHLPSRGGRLPGHPTALKDL